MEIQLFPKQEDFIQSPAKWSAYGGGFGNGKTMSGCLKAYLHCQEQPGAYFLIGRRNATDLRDSTLRDFLGLFSDKNVGTFSKGTSSFKFHNGSEIIFRHLDDLQALTNMNLSGFWIDQAEEIDEAAFTFLVGRARRMRGEHGNAITRREGFVTFNMNGHDWIWRRFKKLTNIDGKPLTNPSDYELIEASTLENKKNLPADYIASLLAMPDDYVKRYVYGSWDVFAGQIFDEFSPLHHVIKPFTIPEGWTRFRAIDHGQNNPTCCLWFAVDWDDNIYVYQEYYQPDMPAYHHIRNIKAMSMIETPTGHRPDNYDYTVLPHDAFYKNREKKSEDGTVINWSIMDEYREAGIPAIRSQSDVNTGIERIHRYLELNKDRIHPFNKLQGEEFTGTPRIFIFNTCEMLLEELPQYKWKALRYGQESNNPNQPVKRNDHATDAFRYGIMSLPMSPALMYNIPDFVRANPLELARYAQSMGMTVEDLVYQRRNNQTVIKHTETERGFSNAGSQGTSISSSGF